MSKTTNTNVNPFGDKMSDAEYSASMRTTIQATRDMNAEEIPHVEKLIADLTQEPFDNFMLPTLTHNFLMVCPADRMDVRGGIKELLLELQKEVTGHPYKDVFVNRMKKVVDDMNYNFEVDNEPDHILFDISQFYTFYFTFSAQLSIQENHYRRKIHKRIREHMIKCTRKALANKQRVVRECDNILSKRFVGEEKQ